MVLVASILAATAPVSAFSLQSLWNLVSQNLNSNVPFDPPHLQAMRLEAKYRHIPGLTYDSVLSMQQVIEEVDGGFEKLDQAFDQLVSKSIPRVPLAHPDITGFEVFQSDDFADYRLRYRSPSSLHVDSTNQYSGYLDYGENFNDHLFFWFFESRNKPSEDPVVLWLNGGPGCSSLTGLFFELGPSSIDADLKPKFNEYSWNNNASIIFVDQPLNVGLSYSDDGTEPVNSVVAERDVYALLETFFQKFPKYAKNDFHIAGESYAGHYIPALASEIWSHEDRSFKLSSLMIGNGLTDPAVQYTSYADMACGRGGYPSVLEPSVCAQMEEDTKRCISLINKCYADQSDWACLPATVYCNNKLFSPYLDAGYNFYDVRQKCGDQPCYIDEEYGSGYINQDVVQRALGLPSHRDFSSCNNKINSEFVNDGDWMRPYNLNVTSLLNAGVPVLVYAGDADFAVNWLGNERWTHALEWNHGTEYRNETLKPWKLDDSEVGQVRSYGPLTFARVYGGGHMLPHDQPKSSLDLFNRWIMKEPYTA